MRLLSHQHILRNSLLFRLATNHFASRSAHIIKGGLLLLFLGSTPIVSASLVPSDRLVDWTPGVAVGVPGGIPTNRTNLIDVTNAPFNADNTGTTDSRARIQAAIDAAKPNDVVYLPAGRYRINGQLRLGNSRSNITLRGAGDSTVIDCRSADYGIGIGTYYAFNWPTTNNDLNPSELRKGATTLTLADTSKFSVGQLVCIFLGDDASIPVMSVFGYDNRPSSNQWQGNRRQITRITAKTSTTLQIFPALYGDYTNAPNARVFTSQIHTYGVGVEDLVIDCENGNTVFPVGFNTAYGCWVKNVTVKNSTNYGIAVAKSLNCEIRECWIDRPKGKGATNHTGILVDAGMGFLIENNVIVANFPSMMISQGSSGNVFAYNFCYDSTSNGSSGASINANHGPHNNFNLYEGNTAPNVQSDGYFGGASHDTFFRNWLHGIQPGIAKATWTVSFNRFTRHYSLVANILGNATYPSEGVSLGNPNMGNGNFTGDGPPWKVTHIDGPGTLSQEGNTVTTSSDIFTPAHVGWFLMIPTTGSFVSIVSYINPRSVKVQVSRTLSGVPYVVAPGPSGYQERDLGVAATLFRAANFNYRDNMIPAGEAPSQPIPASMYLPGKPTWFGSLSWPAYDPKFPSPSFESTPAGYRFIHKSSPSAASQAPTNVRVRIGI